MSHKDDCRELLDVRREAAEVALIEARARLTGELGGMIRMQIVLLTQALDDEAARQIQELALASPVQGAPLKE